VPFPDANHKNHKWFITVTVMLSAVMAAINSSVVNVALPEMKGSLGASTSEITWVATSYMLSNVVIMPSIAFFSSWFGRCRFLLWSVLLFGAGSALCGLARDLPFMIFARTIQGLGGGALIPIAQAILRETFPPEEQGKAMSIYGMGVIMGPAIGPTLGGWLTDNFAWPWIFYINIPILVLNLVLIPIFLKDPPYLERSRGKVDFLGLGSMAVGLSCFQIMLGKGQENNWFQSPFITKLAIVAFAALVFFVWRELSTERPAVNLKVLKNLSFTTGTILSAVLGLALFGSLFLLPMFIQQVRGYSVFSSGMALLPRSIAMFITLPFAGRFYNTLGAKKMVGFGMVISTISFFLMSRLGPETSVNDLLLPQALQGVAFGFIFVSLSTAALSTIPRKDMTAATGLFNLIRTVFGSVGIALSATLLERGTVAARVSMLGNLALTNDKVANWLEKTTSSLVSRGIPPADAPQKALAILNKVVDQQATVIGFNHVFMLITILFIFTFPLIFLFGHKRPGDQVVD